MLTYEYECQACGHTFEPRQEITEPPVAECPECQGRVRRLVSGGAGFILKGKRPGGAEPHGQACSLEKGGGTCCGRDSRCDRPPCGGD
jgi:putative FmdB family regulatory protein